MILRKLKALIAGKPPPVREHPIFGTILFMGKENDDLYDYWEAEVKPAGEKKPICLLINAPLSGPTQQHIDFYHTVSADLDALFCQCWQIFAADFTQWSGKTLPQAQNPLQYNWRNDFELDGITIPQDGDKNKPWDVSYFVQPTGHYFTACFVDGRASYNQIDG